MASSGRTKSEQTDDSNSTSALLLQMPTAGSTRFQVEEVPDTSRGNGHSMAKMDNGATQVDDGMTQVELRSRTNSVVDPTIVDISQPIKVLNAPREIKLKVLVFFLMILIIAGTTCILVFYAEPPLHYKVGRLTFFVDPKMVEVSYRGSNVTRSTVGVNLPLVTPSTCATTTERRLCLEWREYGQLEIDWLELEAMDCYEFLWTALHKDIMLKDCFSLENAHWFGGAVMTNQQWPIEILNMSSQPFLSGDGQSAFGPITERYWLSSNGLGLRVNKSADLFISMDSENQMLCLEVGQQDSPYPNPNNEKSSLQYSACLARDIVSIHRNVSDRFVARTKDSPDSYIITNPTWSVVTPSDKSLWNETLLIDTANLLNNEGYNSGVFEIPTTYAAQEGDLDFDPNRFGSVPDTLAAIKSKRFKTAIQVTPYSSTQSSSFLEGQVNGYWVRDPRNLVPGLTKWNENIGALLDTSSTNAVQWFVSKLESMQSYGLDRFTFDYGQASYLPVGFQTAQLLTNPDDYVSEYVALANRMGSPNVRSAYQSQDIPVIVELVAKDMTWGYDNGLKTVIPTALTMGLQGYPYFMPDLLITQPSDNSRCSQANGCLPDKEFFIRYIELSAFLPAMQIPTFLSEYDDETKIIVKKWVDFHNSTVAPRILTLAEDYISKGDPVLRPLWWIAGADATALRIDSEFLIGDDFLVAPVLDQGATQRDVYLPSGNWVDNSGSSHVGGRWLNDVSVPLGDVAYFTRAS